MYQHVLKEDGEVPETHTEDTEELRTPISPKIRDLVSTRVNRPL